MLSSLLVSFIGLIVALPMYGILFFLGRRGGFKSSIMMGRMVIYRKEYSGKKMHLCIFRRDLIRILERHLEIYIVIASVQCTLPV